MASSSHLPEILLSHPSLSIKAIVTCPQTSLPSNHHYPHQQGRHRKQSAFKSTLFYVTSTSFGRLTIDHDHDHDHDHESSHRQHQQQGRTSGTHPPKHYNKHKNNNDDDDSVNEKNPSAARKTTWPPNILNDVIASTSFLGDSDDSNSGSNSKSDSNSNTKSNTNETFTFTNLQSICILGDTPLRHLRDNTPNGLLSPSSSSSDSQDDSEATTSTSTSASAVTMLPFTDAASSSYNSKIQAHHAYLLKRARCKVFFLDTGCASPCNSTDTSVDRNINRSTNMNTNSKSSSNSSTKSNNNGKIYCYDVHTGVLTVLVKGLKKPGNLGCSEWGDLTWVEDVFLRKTICKGGEDEVDSKVKAKGNSEADGDWNGRGGGNGETKGDVTFTAKTINILNSRDTLNHSVHPLNKSPITPNTNTNSYMNTMNKFIKNMIVLPQSLTFDTDNVNVIPRLRSKDGCLYVSFERTRARSTRENVDNTSSSSSTSRHASNTVGSSILCFHPILIDTSTSTSSSTPRTMTTTMTNFNLVMPLHPISSKYTPSSLYYSSRNVGVEPRLTDAFGYKYKSSSPSESSPSPSMSMSMIMSSTSVVIEGCPIIKDFTLTLDGRGALVASSGIGGGLGWGGFGCGVFYVGFNVNDCEGEGDGDGGSEGGKDKGEKKNVRVEMICKGHATCVALSRGGLGGNLMVERCSGASTGRSRSRSVHALLNPPSLSSERDQIFYLTPPPSSQLFTLHPSTSQSALNLRSRLASRFSLPISPRLIDRLTDDVSSVDVDDGGDDGDADGGSDDEANEHLFNDLSKALINDTSNDHDHEPNLNANLNVKVLIRVRPLLPNELLTSPPTSSCATTTRTGLTLSHLYLPSHQSRTYDFDRVFSPDDGQGMVYAEVVKPIVRRVMEGFNGTVLAYGQTGAGKTFTMEGRGMNASPSSSSSDKGGGAEEVGLIPRAVHTIFNELDNLDCSDGGSGGRCKYKYNITASHMEIYMEQPYDLLVDKSGMKQRLEIVEERSWEEEQEGKNRGRKGKARSSYTDNSTSSSNSNSNSGIKVLGLSTHLVKKPSDIFRLMHRARKNRHTAETLCNRESSRSHAVFTLNVTITRVRIRSHTTTNANANANNESFSETSETTRGKLHLVDLSGSECIKKSGASGVTKDEAVSIGKSLLSLGRVIRSLVHVQQQKQQQQQQQNGGNNSSGNKNKKQNKVHIPYRDSKLTRLLSGSLGGSSYTALILCVNPGSGMIAETVSTLSYGMLARGIRNRPVRDLRVVRKRMRVGKEKKGKKEGRRKRKNGEGGEGENKSGSGSEEDSDSEANSEDEDEDESENEMFNKDGELTSLLDEALALEFPFVIPWVSNVPLKPRARAHVPVHVPVHNTSSNSNAIQTNSKTINNHAHTYVDVTPTPMHVPKVYHEETEEWVQLVLCDGDGDFTVNFNGNGNVNGNDDGSIININNNNVDRQRNIENINTSNSGRQLKGMSHNLRKCFTSFFAYFDTFNVKRLNLEQYTALICTIGASSESDFSRDVVERFKRNRYAKKFYRSNSSSNSSSSVGTSTSMSTRVSVSEEGYLHYDRFLTFLTLTARDDPLSLRSMLSKAGYGLNLERLDTDVTRTSSSYIDGGVDVDEKLRGLIEFGTRDSTICKGGKGGMKRIDGMGMVGSSSASKISTGRGRGRGVINNSDGRDRRPLSALQVRKDVFENRGTDKGDTRAATNEHATSSNSSSRSSRSRSRNNNSNNNDNNSDRPTSAVLRKSSSARKHHDNTTSSANVNANTLGTGIGANNQSKGLLRASSTLKPRDWQEFVMKKRRGWIKSATSSASNGGNGNDIGGGRGAPQTGGVVNQSHPKVPLLW